MMTKTISHLIPVLMLLLSGYGCVEKEEAQPRAEAKPQQTSLKEAFRDAFLIGVGVNEAQIREKLPKHVELIKTQYNSITAENLLKWESVHPQPDQYNFEPADRFVEFGEKYGMTVIGHVLVWHNQTPAWVFQDDNGERVSRDVLLERMRDHIHTVVGRYKGRIKGWDVVNEAVNDDGSLRQTPWYEIIGGDYIQKAFEFAREADPKAGLYYNDYSVVNAEKRKGIIKLVKKLQSTNTPITGIGLQQHINMTWPTLEQLDTTINELSELGLDLMVTELDIDVLPSAWDHRGADITLNVELNEQLNPYVDGLPDAVQQALADRYTGLFGIYYKHRGVIKRVTFWNVTDAESWLNNWPVRGRTAYPLLFDRNAEPKPAYYSVLNVPQNSKL